MVNNYIMEKEYNINESLVEYGELHKTYPFTYFSF